MASHNDRIPLMKFVATGVGLALCGVDTWLNAEHIAHVEGWASSLVAAVVVASIGASAALPLAERAAKTRQAAKAVGLALFFVVMVAFSFCASVERIGGKRDGETASARSDNERVKLLREGYNAAKKTADAECAKGQGKKCRAAEEAVTKARESLGAKPAERVVDSMAVRISAALPFMTAEAVELYQPLVLPFGLQLGGFLMLALGLSPALVAKPTKPEPDVRKRRGRPRGSRNKVKAIGNVVNLREAAKRAAD
jgi:hypothetical protein